MAATALVDLLIEVRDHYLDFYRSIVRTERERASASGAPPPAIGLQVAIGDGSNPHGSRFNLPMRLDVVAGGSKNPRILKVERDTTLSFEPLVVTFAAGFEVAIEPFHWDECDVVFDGDLDDWRPLLDWFEAWFDRDDRLPEDADGLAPVIHEMTEPRETELGTGFTVDFGAAPVDAFEALMVALRAKGAKDIRVGTFYER